MKFLKSIIFLAAALLVGAAAFGREVPQEWSLTAFEPTSDDYYGVTVANGTIGLVSSAEPFGIGETVLAGVYDHFGRGRVNNFLPNINPLGIEMSLDGKITRGNIDNFVQTLDMRSGEFIGDFDRKGAHVTYSYCALRHLPHAVLMDIEVSVPREMTMTVKIKHTVPQSLHDAEMTTNLLVSPYKSEPPFTMITTAALSPSETVKTAASSVFLFPQEDEAMPIIHQVPDNDMHYISFTKTLPAGTIYHFQVVGSLISSAHTADPLNQAERIVTYARFQKRGELIAKHRQAWEKLWQSDIEIEGDLQAQKEVRSMLYHLYSFSREDVASSVSPMGLSGLGYNGHVFWDTETFMMPVLMLLQPQMAESMLEYRYERLDEARRNAASYGFSGAMFPWESASTGAEDCPVRSLSGTFQHHVTADVAIACWKYYLATQDKDWLAGRGWHILKATAEFWASRCEKGDDGRWHIYNVMCADEWALNVDDNAYTNGSAKRNLEYAVEAGKVLGIKTPALWTEIADGLFFETMENGVTSEYVGYDGYDIKQADVNLLAYPLGLVTDKAQMLRDLDYYSVRVPQKKTPAMTQSMFSVICSRCGQPEKAWEWFVDSYRPNACPPFGVLAEFKGGTNPYFATGAGGTLQAVVMGFGGLDFNPKGGIMQVREHALPPHWKRLTLKGVGPEKKTYTITQ